MDTDNQNHIGGDDEDNDEAVNMNDLALAVISDPEDRFGRGRPRFAGERPRFAKDIYDQLRDKDEWTRHGPVNEMMVDLFMLHMDICDETEFFKHGVEVEETVSDFTNMLMQDHTVKAVLEHGRPQTVPVLDPDYAKMAFSLRAAWKAWQGYGAAGKGFEPTDFMMQHSLGVFLGFEEEETVEEGQLGSLLEGMIARVPKEFKNKVNKELGWDLEEEDVPAARVDRVTVFIGTEVIEVSFEELLSCFWTKRLDTTCHTCDGPFHDEPPIRTIIQHSSKSEKASYINMRIFNRHSSCLEAAGIVYVPVSHVWHDSVRKANELRGHHSEAAWTLIDTLVGLFQGAERAYNPGTEFWHDYFSVPQWEPEIRDQLLLYLPSIYHQADEILVHVSDLRESYVKSLMMGMENCMMTDNAPELHELSLGHSILAFPALLALRHSQWMQRMWVTIEYTRSKRACIMDGSNYVMRSRQEKGRYSQDTFTKLLQGARAHTREFYRHTDKFPPSLRTLCQELMKIPHKNTERERVCLGEATEVIARKQCHLTRDRLIAIHLLLNEGKSPKDQIRIPQDEDDAFCVVWGDALAKNDYSVLLLQPREDVSLSNPEPQATSFLIGFGNLEGAYWQLGGLQTPALRPIEIVDHAPQIEVESLGGIGDIHFLKGEDAGDVDGVEWAIRLLIRIARREGVALSAQNLFEGLNRVFCFNFTSLGLENDFTFSAFQERDSDFGNKLQERLERYRTCPAGASGNDSRRNVAEEIWKIMSFDEIVLNEKEKEFKTLQYTRWDLSHTLAGRRWARGCRRGEPICEVRCPQCRVITLYRLDLRISAQVGDKVYRVPGLAYHMTEKNGAGLVINRDGRITGRMCFGSPLCDCQVVEKVRIF